MRTVLAAALALLTGCGVPHIEFHDPPADWQRHALPNGPCSAEFPCEPWTIVPRTDDSALGAGFPSVYLLACTELPVEFRRETDEATLRGVADVWAEREVQNPGQRVRGWPVPVSGCSGYELVIEEPDERGAFRPVSHCLLTVRDTTVYVATVSPYGPHFDASRVRRFFDSVRLE